MPKQVLPILESPTPTACCAPIAEQAVSGADAIELAASFKALGDPIRLQLLSMIASAEGGEICVCDLTPAFAVSGPTISHHLRVLREAGLISGDRRGTWVYYRADPAKLAALSAVLGVPASVAS
jgi:ArsR family transcriptional regulator